MLLTVGQERNAKHCKTILVGLFFNQFYIFYQSTDQMAPECVTQILEP